MIRITTVIIVSLLSPFQAYAEFKPALPQHTAPSAIGAKPTGSVKPALAKPDLVIEHFSLSPKTPKNGDTCNYKLTVKNQGGSSSQTKMWVGLNITPQLGLPQKLDVPKAGQTLTFTGPIGIPVDVCGPTPFTAELDVHNVVKESDENNNTATTSVTVQNRPDLGFCKTTGSCPGLYTAGTAGKKIPICVDVYNYGCAANKAGTLTFNCPEQWPVTVPIPPVSPDKFWAHCEFRTWTTAGTRNCRVIINFHLNQDDAYKFNQDITYKVTVTPN